MKDTKLLYMEDMQTVIGEATVQEVVPLEGHVILILDQTLFYPQGGGQPFDQGTIETQDSVFKVEEVRYFNGMGVVKHIGHFEKGTIVVGQKVTLKIDPVRRALMSRLHSAGHAIDIAVGELKLPCKPGRGCHYPEGAFVEYTGDLDGLNAAELKEKLEKLCEKIVQTNAPIQTEFVTADIMRARGLEVPPGIPAEKPLRLVSMGSYCMPCGGTHVKALQAIGKILIKKVTLQPGIMRISYAIEQTRTK